MTQPLDPSQQKLNDAQAELYEAQAQQARFSSLVPDLTKVASGALDTSNDKAGMASALSFVAMKHAAQRACRSLREKIGDMSTLRLLVTVEPNLATSSSAGVDVAFELDQLNKRAEDLLKAYPPKPANAAHIVGVTAIGLAAAALPGVLSLFAKHDTLVTGTVAANDQAAVAAVCGALLSQQNGPQLKSDTFQRAVRGPLYHQADQLAVNLARLQSLDEAATTQDVKDLIKLIENTLAAITSVPKGGTLSPLAAASFWDNAFGGQNPITHILLVKSETGGTAEFFEQRQLVSDRAFLTATASVTYMLIDAASVIRAAGTESATVQMHGKIDEIMTASIIKDASA